MKFVTLAAISLVSGSAIPTLNENKLAIPKQLLSAFDTAQDAYRASVVVARDQGYDAGSYADRIQKLFSRSPASTVKIAGTDAAPPTSEASTAKKYYKKASDYFSSPDAPSYLEYFKKAKEYFAKSNGTPKETPEGTPKGTPSGSSEPAGSQSTSYSEYFKKAKDYFSKSTETPEGQDSTYAKYKKQAQDYFNSLPAKEQKDAKPQAPSVKA